MTLFIKVLPAKSFIFSSTIPSDFRSGSFLTSYLMGTVCTEILKQGGKVVLPKMEKAEDQYIYHPIINQIMENSNVNSELGWIGSIPNVLRIEIPSSFNEQSLFYTLKQSWIMIGEYIWDQLLKDNAKFGDKTRDIWVSQMSCYWQMYWAFGNNLDYLFRRSLWNTYATQVDNSSNRCILFKQFQEISGHNNILDRDYFWNSVNDSLYEKKKMTLNLNMFSHDKIYLSAVGLVKRVFPLFSNEIVGISIFNPSINQLYMSEVLLLIDFDSIGVKMDYDHELSYWLLEFIREITKKVKKLSATVIYAGGDECLIKVPIKNLIPLLRIIYDKVNNKKESRNNLTISASLSVYNGDISFNKQTNYLRWSIKYLVKKEINGDGILVSKWSKKNL
ncbi:Cas10/Cmr2 second palm domain-containing protein [Thermoactinomyces mirandus]|uniref:GGDEF domain-containing protein n=1 Tax=Thermoactinomyces mirandus TaxID=2756294 RepID=A0A7W2AS15_9BACL|nr:type III-B CRISPR-associated protein Cas10/Cmr2 [Thermoactinomyces mirandus]MBA4601971.1 hypothetical protein [Thermoactinomyces mirandus]